VPQNDSKQANSYVMTLQRVNSALNLHHNQVCSVSVHAA